MNTRFLTILLLCLMGCAPSANLDNKAEKKVLKWMESDLIGRTLVKRGGKRRVLDHYSANGTRASVMFSDDPETRSVAFPYEWKIDSSGVLLIQVPRMETSVKKYALVERNENYMTTSIEGEQVTFDYSSETSDDIAELLKR